MFTRILPRPDPETEEIIRLCLSTLHASAAMFYWVGPARRMVDVSLAGVPEPFLRRYAEGMEAADPSNITRLAGSGAKVAQLGNPRPEFAADAARFSSFLGGFGGVDVIDMIFRAGGEEVAGIGVMKMQGDRQVDEAALATARAVQRFVEFGLQRHERVMRARLPREHGLTGREWEVAALAGEGLSNQAIAARLHVSLPTVKSHLQSVFAKTGCANRTRLAVLLA
jgi:DNA-binding CsgD family transcriptional regulator